ncbi:Asp-tRNA(Asn)/Glu-tRNA(Gln) amidotransferase subunit GatC [Fodinibius salsisoli]|uniref:Aspartyl/glutamyl-tRNA(Asn/Gln) amidotransferase subunit C n=1 Tax=Fodinibius salsisoli TaxID=2820877 RepID=A0ABT3PRP3_9BACT|nr:Asp-tRNA(Asn)/Glu-tRNA(Gln) amidotransferase subunit GatC [Fodinibius salsisoli]MCW9708530.1 Asp-tRNA(Asn)/Glu-tRNA(Gln) amidotransferase subunit GatC [Fodinibius salsisoli]
MSVSKKDVKYVADLAHLQLTEEESDSLVHDMNQILDYMTTLEEVDTSDVEPLEHVIDLEYRLRDDKAEAPLDHKEALKNAPDADTDYFRVPRVID